jgi:hypothetical protein
LAKGAGFKYRQTRLILLTRFALLSTLTVIDNFSWQMVPKSRPGPWGYSNFQATFRVSILESAPTKSTKKSIVDSEQGILWRMETLSEVVPASSSAGRSKDDWNGLAGVRKKAVTCQDPLTCSDSEVIHIDLPRCAENLCRPVMNDQSFYVAGPCDQEQ